MGYEPLQLLSDDFGVIKLVIDRNVSDPSGVIRKGLRPDLLCWAEGTLLLIGEEKDVPGEFLAALDDLETKREPDTRCDTGTLSIFAYAAGGSIMQ